MIYLALLVGFLLGVAFRNVTARRQLIDLTVAIQHREIGRDLRVIKGGRP